MEHHHNGVSIAEDQYNYDDPLRQLLREVQLEHFYEAIKSIDVTKVEHFENVLFTDLTGPQIGMGAPAARRLLEAAKKRNNKWKKNLLNIILPGTGGSSSSGKIKDKESASSDRSLFDEKQISDKENINQNSGNESGGLTCLISNKDIKLLDKIGDGSFGVVMRAQWKQQNKTIKHVAVKVLKQEVLSRALEDFAKEVNAMHQLKHQNLIRLHGIVLSSPMMMVTELAEQGSLRTKLIRTKRNISLTTLVNYSYQIANGMDYLESKRLIHRDLATRNIFITGNDMIKIGDFGLMRSVPCNEDYYTMSDNMKVPFPWCALESLKYRQFSHASDTWMYGVTLWEIFSFGQEPWAGLIGSQIIRKLEQNERLSQPLCCSNKIYQVMKLCWNNEPKERPTFTALLKFFQSAQPIKLRAMSDFDNFLDSHSKFVTDGVGKTFLKLSRGDEIHVIDGKPENYWWKGQNQHTYEIGLFPRSIAKDLKSCLNSNDISKPLKNSFIHTGHMDPLGKNSWGNPEFIEKMYLENPIEPQDLYGHECDDSDKKAPLVFLETRSGKKKFSKEDNSKRIEKINNIDELDVKNQNNGFLSDESPTKEGILIDFENEINHVPATTIPNILDSNTVGITSGSNDAKKSSNHSNELADIKFSTQEILDLYKKDFKWHKEEEESQESFDQNTSEGDKNSKSIENDVLDQQQSSKVENKEPVVGTSASSKYYMPPYDTMSINTNVINNTINNFDDNCPPPSATNTTKGRYYSSVCSNCDFSSISNNDIVGAGRNYNEQTNVPTCQCCQFDFPSYNTCSSHFMTGNCFIDHHGFCPPPPVPVSSIKDNYFPPPPPPLPPEADSPVMTPLSSSLDNKTTTKTVFQTKICKDFIDELEANFSKIGGQMKTTSQRNSSNSTTNTTVYPTINPPPKSYKTRRPAPPPPIIQQKKN